MLRASVSPIAEGAGRSTRGTPKPMTTASHRKSSQAPNSTGTSMAGTRMAGEARHRFPREECQDCHQRPEPERRLARMDHPEDDEAADGNQHREQQAFDGVPAHGGACRRASRWARPTRATSTPESSEAITRAAQICTVWP